MRSIKIKANRSLIKVLMLMLIMTTMLPYIALADDDPGPCPDCPIDGGLVLLLVAGAVYGIWKYRFRVKNYEL